MQSNQKTKNNDIINNKFSILKLGVHNFLKTVLMLFVILVPGTLGFILSDCVFEKTLLIYFYIVILALWTVLKFCDPGTYKNFESDINENGKIMEIESNIINLNMEISEKQQLLIDSENTNDVEKFENDLVLDGISAFLRIKLFMIISLKKLSAFCLESLMFLIDLIIIMFNILILPFTGKILFIDRGNNDIDISKILVRDEETGCVYQGTEKCFYCIKCESHVPLRTKHCDFCNKCINLHDHHCMVLNNCIGSDNKGVFITFLFYLILVGIFTIIINLKFVSKSILNIDTMIKFHNINDQLSMTYSYNLTNKFIIKLIILILITLYCFMITLSCCYLLFLQVFLSMMNLTFREIFTDKRLSYFERYNLNYGSPFNIGNRIKNSAFVLWLPYSLMSIIKKFRHDYPKTNNYVIDSHGQILWIPQYKNRKHKFLIYLITKKMGNICSG